ncbi:ABC transporter substrate-binding protein [Pseudomonas stutzeri]|nr:ABC transporter substrate-binding protein [Stutzerimonas stutzeri]
MRFLQALALFCLLATSAFSQAAEILVAAGNDTPALRRFVAELAARRPDDRVRFLPLAALGAPAALPPDSRLVLLGADALDWRLGEAAGPPTLVLQISRVQAFGRLREQRPPRLTLLWSDPPPARQLRLIRQLLPHARRVGVLYADDSRFMIDELRRLAAAQGLVVTPWYWPDNRDNRPLNRLLDSSDVLLGIDDPALYNPATIKGLLLASYGRRLALVGPTAAFVRAGSLSSSYSDQQDWLDELDQLLALEPRAWPREAYPRRFKVLGNPQVARSLGVGPSDDRDQALRLQQWEHAQ